MAFDSLFRDDLKGVFPPFRSGLENLTTLKLLATDDHKFSSTSYLTGKITWLFFPKESEARPRKHGANLLWML
ncbi:hypothetical protein GF406_10380 [candidate division KSB1 bacterium]|nr:hypothetical protein [candidate division KSB1 bacterium]